MRVGASGGCGGCGGGGSGVGGARKELKITPLVFQAGEADWLALGERRAHALAVFERKDLGAIEAAGAGEERCEAAETGGADSAASEGWMEGQAQAAAPAAAPEPAEERLEVRAARPPLVPRLRRLALCGYGARHDGGRFEGGHVLLVLDPLPELPQSPPDDRGELVHADVAALIGVDFCRVRRVGRAR